MRSVEPLHCYDPPCLRPSTLLCVHVDREAKKKEEGKWGDRPGEWTVEAARGIIPAEHSYLKDLWIVIGRSRYGLNISISTS